MRPFHSEPDPATITPGRIDLFGAGGRTREDTRNAIVFRARAAERSAAAVLAIEAMHTAADAKYRAWERRQYLHGQRIKLTRLAPINGGNHGTI